MTPGDLAKALHDAHGVLGYWPDPDRIDGRWEVWGVALLAALPAAVPRPEGLDVEALATALERTYQGSHPSSARRDDWVSDASFVADEYAAILARLSGTGDTLRYSGALNTDLAGDETSPPHRPDCLCSVCYVKRP